MSAPLAYLCPRRTLRCLEPDGTDRSLSHPGLGWVGLQPDDRSSLGFPTWAPDGRRIAAFETLVDPTGADRPRIRLLAVDGQRDVASDDLDGRSPVYLAWSRDGAHVASLSQGEQALVLSTVRTDDGSGLTDRAEGSPLYLTWTDRHLAAYVGQRWTEGEGDLQLHDPTRAAGVDVTTLPSPPRNFCAPVWRHDALFYVAEQPGGGFAIESFAPDTGEVRSLAPVSGLVALVADRAGRHLLAASAPRGDGTPYEVFQLLDLVTGARRDLDLGPCLAVLFAPDGASLYIARVDTQLNLLRWEHRDLDDRDGRPLAAMRPTRELAFYLRFFEQFSQSHHLVHPEGEHLVVGGELARAPHPGHTPTLWALSPDGREPEALADGVFATYPAQPPGRAHG